MDRYMKEIFIADERERGLENKNNAAGIRKNALFRCPDASPPFGSGALRFIAAGSFPIYAGHPAPEGSRR